MNYVDNSFSFFELDSVHDDLGIKDGNAASDAHVCVGQYGS